MERKQYKAINFDLDTHKLKIFYSSSRYQGAYDKIRRFLEKRGFVHRQWSGYQSINKMSDAEITFIITEMGKHFPWLAQCVNRIDITNIGRNYDLTAALTPETDDLDLPEHGTNEDGSN